MTHREKSVFNLCEIPQDVFQAHLERISDYLKAGVWWHHDIRTNDIIFHDSDSCPDIYTEGPDLMEFTNSSIRTVQNHLKEAWEYCINNDVKLPLEKVKIFNDAGEKVDEKFSLNVSYTEEIQEEEEGDENAEREISVQATQKHLLEDTPVTAKPNRETLKQNITAEAEESYCFKSSTGRSLSKLLGNTKDVIRFDKHHHLFKVLQKESSRKLCHELLPMLQQQSLQAYREAEKSMDSWNKKFYLENERDPMANDIKINQDALFIYRKLECGRKILRSWNITF